MKRRILSIITALALCMGLLPGTASAGETGEEDSAQPRAASTDINMMSGFVFAQGVPIVIKNNDGITSIYATDGNLLSGDTDVSSCAIYGGWYDPNNIHTSSTSIVMESGTVPVIYGGSYGDTLVGNTNVVLNGGTVGWVYGGGCQSTVTGDTHVTVNRGAKVWGQKRTDPSAAVRGTVFGGGQGGAVGSTEVIFYGGDAQWIYGGGDYVYDQNGSPTVGCTCTNTTVKFMGQPDDFVNVFGGGNGGSADKTVIEFHGNGSSLTNTSIFVYGGGWEDAVGEARIIVGANSDPSTVFYAKHPDSSNSTVGTASFEVHLDGGRPSMMNSSGLNGTGVTGDVTATIYGDATTDAIFETGLTDIKQLIVESGTFSLPSSTTLERLEIKDSGTAVVPGYGGGTTLGTLAGSGTVLFYRLKSHTGDVPAVTVNAVSVPGGSRIKVGHTGGGWADAWEEAVVFQGPGIGALESASCFSSKELGFYLEKDGNSIWVKAGTEQKATAIDPTPHFDKPSYQYGETMTITMGLKSEGSPVSGQTLEVRGGASGLQTFATAVTGEDGQVSFTLPVDDNLWASRENGLQAIFHGSEEYTASFYGISLKDGDGSMSYVVTGAQAALGGGITAPSRGGIPVETLTVGGNAICTAEVVWSPADAAFRPEVTYTASIRLVPKPGYSLDGGRLGSVTYQGQPLTIPSSAEADGSMVIPDVVTFAPIPAIHVADITLDEAALSLTVGETAQLTAAITPSDADNKTVTWASSDTAVAMVDESGNVAAIGEGTATITVTTADGGKTDSCTVTVIAPVIHVSGVTLNKTDLTLTVSGSEQLTATVVPGDAADKTVTWVSGDTAVATVDASGNVTAAGVGTATITVTTADGGKTAVCTVTVRSGGGYVPPFPSDPSTPSTPDTPSTSGGSTVTVPVSGGQSTVRVSASVSGSTAIVSRIDTAQIDRVIGDNGQAGMVEIDFTGLGGDIDTVTLPAGAVKDIAAKAQNEEIGGLTVKLPGGEVSFDAKALAAIQNQAGSQITLAVTRVKSGGLNDRQNEAAGGAPVFELTLRGSSGAIIDFSGGHATVSLPYELTAGQDPDRVAVYHLDSAGNTTLCDTRYDVRTGSAVFTTGHFALYFVGYDTAAGESLFSDVAGDAWHYDAVRFVSENGLMGGYGNGLFGPDDNLSRAQFAQILHNREGRPVVNYLMQFGDVSGGAWYAEAVRWAAAQGIAGGHDDGMFGPDENITREQLAVMLWRYAGCPAAAGRELDFTDAGEASGYALDALRWAMEKEIINGSGGGQLAPKGLATRAQAAQMLMNFLKNE